MTKTVKALLCCAALLCAGQAFAAPLHTPAARKLLEVFPDALKHTHTSSADVLTFCPDNTCIEVRSTRSANAEAWSLVYLYHLGDYYDLARWRALPGIKAEIEDLSKSLQVGACLGRQPDRACFLKRMTQNGVEAYDVRYDEGGRTSVRVK